MLEQETQIAQSYKSLYNEIVNSHKQRRTVQIYQIHQQAKYTQILGEQFKGKLGFFL